MASESRPVNDRAKSRVTGREKYPDKGRKVRQSSSGALFEAALTFITSLREEQSLFCGTIFLSARKSKPLKVYSLRRKKKTKWTDQRFRFEQLSC